MMTLPAFACLLLFATGCGGSVHFSVTLRQSPMRSQRGGFSSPSFDATVRNAGNRRVGISNHPLDVLRIANIECKGTPIRVEAESGKSEPALPANVYLLKPHDEIHFEIPRLEEWPLEHGNDDIDVKHYGIVGAGHCTVRFAIPVQTDLGSVSMTSNEVTFDAR